MQRLHCSKCAHEGGPDETYEKDQIFKLEKTEMLLLKTLFWDKHRCAVEVDMSQVNVRKGKSHPLTIEGTAPHIRNKLLTLTFTTVRACQLTARN